MNSQDVAVRKSRAAILSVASNSLLVVGKIIVGLVVGSVSILSEAIHSGIDLIAAAIAWWAVRQSAKPADEEHPFGHGKFENLSGAIEALLIFVAAGWIVVEAVDKLQHPAPLEGIGWGVAVMGVSAIANYLVSFWLFRVGRATDSMALMADGWHLRTDVYTSVGVAAGLFVVAVGERLFPGRSLAFLDPLIAIGVALLILKAAVQLTLGSLKDLLDVRLPPEEVGWIIAYLRGRDDIPGFHDLRTRKAGGERFIEVHLELAPEMSVRESHDIARSVSHGIRQHLSGATVTVHVDPGDRDHPGEHSTTARRSTPVPGGQGGG